MSRDPIAATAFLARSSVERLSATLDCCYPLAHEEAFEHLLSQLDEIEIEPFDVAANLRSEPDEAREA